MLGKPKYQLGNKVTFKIEEKEYKGNIYIIDSYGTFEDDSNVSYDIMVDNWGPKKEQCLFKHINENLIKNYMKIFFDTEFTGLHKNTTLISIGLVAEDGREFYGELNDYDESQCDDWIKENVISHLIYKDCKGSVSTYNNGLTTYVNGDKSYIANQLDIWFSRFDNIELVSDVCHYDMMLLIDLFGSAFDLPKHINPACHDINQDIANRYDLSETWAFNKSREELLKEYNKTIEGNKHNALYDAKVIKAIYEIVNNDYE